MSIALTLTSIVTFPSTVVECNTIQVSSGPLLLLFSGALVVLIFSALRKHDLVANLIGLLTSITVITRLII